MSSSEEDVEKGISGVDIQIEIIKRLPIKSVLKFMCVSKTWQSIIQSSPFIADYNRSHIQPHNQLFVVYRNQNFVNIYDDDNNRFLQHLKLLPGSSRHAGDFKSIGYSQGLFGFHNYKDTVYIWNPSIRKYVTIPLPGYREETDDFGFTVVGNATEPTIFKITYTPRLQVDFCRLSTRNWTSMSNDPPRESLGFTRTWVVIDRFIHWVAYEGDRYLILSFDITSQQFTELCLPPTLQPHPSSSSSSLKLGLSKHKESLVVLETYEGKQEIGVWMMMMEPGGVHHSFKKLYTTKPSPYPLIPESVLGFTKDGQPMFTVHVCSVIWMLFFHEPDSEAGFNYNGSISGRRCIDLAGSYMETLLLLGH